MLILFFGCFFFIISMRKQGKIKYTTVESPKKVSVFLNDKNRNIENLKAERQLIR